MSERKDIEIITKLEAKLKAQQKTIEVLMNAAEQRASDGLSSMEILSQNLALERVVQQKTSNLQRQGEELKKALHELQLSQTQLLQAQKLESVGQLAAGIAHEINTPTQYISSNLDFLADSFTDVKRLVDNLKGLLQQIDQGTPIAEPCKMVENLLEELDWKYLETEIPTAIEQSREGVKRVTTIVGAMKEFSHPGSREKDYYDLNRILETTITVTSNEWKYCAEIETHLAANLPKVYCLSDEIGQVFLNILINASHAIASKNMANNEKGRITISSRHTQDYVEICIEDTGIGIPENIRERVFDPFFTTKEVGKGSGQGLAIAHDVIENKHDGTLRLTSVVGVGTTFTIQLPIKGK
ncbi:MAG: ATP-binding protein [Desulforhopalus sp.]|nr:ATP-binding protein [Desulforhopalus sp.]